MPDGVGARLGVEVAQGREQYADREIRLEVTNESDETLTLLSGELRAEGFGPSHPTKESRGLVLRPGATRAVHLGLGEPECPDGGTGAGAASRATPSAVITLARREGDVAGPPTDVTVSEVGDPHEHLARNHTTDCADAAVAAGARLTVDPEISVETRDGGLTALVTLRFDPVAGGPDVTVDRVGETTLMSNPEPGEAVPGWAGRELVGQRTGEMVLSVVPARCDVHAVAEDKRGTFLPVHTHVDGVRQELVYVPMPDAARADLYAFVGDRCGWPE